MGRERRVVTNAKLHCMPHKNAFVLNCTGQDIVLHQKTLWHRGGVDTGRLHHARTVLALDNTMHSLVDRIATRIADDSARPLLIIEAVMSMPMDPYVGALYQRVKPAGEGWG